MNIILLSGGSGKRLWPLSNDVRSKQFIKLFKNDDGIYESMLQRIYNLITKGDNSSNVTIATSKSQVSSIKSQLGDKVSICVEPCRRDTFPAIVLSSVYLYEKVGIDRDDVVIVCPVDPYVDSSYIDKMKEICEVCKCGQSNIVLMGIEPTYPSEKYGYIIPNDKNDVSFVDKFKEKPDVETAKLYIESGALWNGGVFAYKLDYILRKAHEFIDFKNYDDLLSKYDQLDKISFDYRVLEQEESVQVVRFNGQWKDLGTWNTLTETMDDFTLGNVVMDDTCVNTHVVNDLDIPILTMGLNNVVVSASPQGILVADKQSSSNMKKYVEKINQQIMFADKSWGNFQVIDIENDSMTLKVNLIKGHKMKYHSHTRRDEIWNIISGEGRVVINDECSRVKVGDVIRIAANDKHTIIADTDLELIEVQLGKDIDVNDKKKYVLKIDNKRS